MKSQKSKKILKVIGIIVGVVALVALVIALSLKQLPVRVLTSYTFDTLWEEGTTMHECAECHDTKEEFHTCSTCHDEHGSVELPELYFYTMLEVTGDVDKVILYSYQSLFQLFRITQYFPHRGTVHGKMGDQRVSKFHHVYPGW
jgi:hypothetical protein